MRKQILLLRDPSGILDALDTEPKIGSIDLEVGEKVVSKMIATMVHPNMFNVTIWHESDFCNKNCKRADESAVVSHGSLSDNRFIEQEETDMKT